MDKKASITVTAKDKAVDVQTDDTGNGNICINCALCCDGSLFPKAAIHPSDNSSFLKQMGFASATEGIRQVFHLPCYALDGNICTLYHDPRRFRACRRFKCKLLKQFLSGEVSYSTALQTIGEVKKRRLSLQKLEAVFPTPADTNILSLINKIWQSGKMAERSFRQTYAQQLLDCVILVELLKSRFYRKSLQPSDTMGSTE